jgi:MFS family permease
VGCLTYEFQVTLPVMASRGLNVGASGFGFMTAAMGLGAVFGGLAVAARGRTGLRTLVLSALMFGLAMTFATVAPGLEVELVALAVVGGASISFMSSGNSTLQLAAAPGMRGRVMSLWFVAFQGSTPVGGPIVGVVMAAFGARAGLGLGAATCVIVAGAGWLALGRRLRLPEKDGRDTSSQRTYLDHAPSGAGGPRLQPVDALESAGALEPRPPRAPAREPRAA